MSDCQAISGEEGSSERRVSRFSKASIATTADESLWAGVKVGVYGSMATQAGGQNY